MSNEEQKVIRHIEVKNDADTFESVALGAEAEHVRVDADGTPRRLLDVIGALDFDTSEQGGETSTNEKDFTTAVNNESTQRRASDGNLDFKLQTDSQSSEAGNLTAAINDEAFIRRTNEGVDEKGNITVNIQHNASQEQKSLTAAIDLEADKRRTQLGVNSSTGEFDSFKLMTLKDDTQDANMKIALEREANIRRTNEGVNTDGKLIFNIDTDDPDKKNPENLTDAINKEAKLRRNNDKILTDNLNTEIVTRKNLIGVNEKDQLADLKIKKDHPDELIDDLVTVANYEYDDRKAHDGDLQFRIDTDNVDKNQPTNLTDAINKEAHLRRTDDGDLNFSNIETDKKNPLTNLTDAINQEALNRKNNDTALTTKIDTEINDRATADGNLQFRIDTDEPDTQETQPADLTAAINKEAKLRRDHRVNWEENNPDSQSFIQNRPFYDTGEKILNNIWEHNFTFNNEGFFAKEASQEQLPLEKDHTYHVYITNLQTKAVQEFIVVNQDISFAGYQQNTYFKASYLGNPSLLSGAVDSATGEYGLPDTGVDFVLGFLQSSYYDHQNPPQLTSEGIVIVSKQYANLNVQLSVIEELPNIHYLDHKFISPDHQSDFNQNNKMDSTYIKNRPCYKSVEKNVALLDRCRLPFNYYGSTSINERVSITVGETMTPYMIELEQGRKYIVTISNHTEKKECIAQPFEIGDSSTRCLYLGNINMATGSEEALGEDFAIVMIKDLASEMIQGLIVCRSYLKKYDSYQNIEQIPIEDKDKDTLYIDNTTNKGYKWDGEKFNEITTDITQYTPDKERLISINGDRIEFKPLEPEFVNFSNYFYSDTYRYGVDNYTKVQLVGEQLDEQGRPIPIPIPDWLQDEYYGYQYESTTTGYADKPVTFYDKFNPGLEHTVTTDRYVPLPSYSSGYPLIGIKRIPNDNQFFLMRGIPEQEFSIGDTPKDTITSVVPWQKGFSHCHLEYNHYSLPMNFVYKADDYGQIVFYPGIVDDTGIIDDMSNYECCLESNYDIKGDWTTGLLVPLSAYSRDYLAYSWKFTGTIDIDIVDNMMIVQISNYGQPLRPDMSQTVQTPGSACEFYKLYITAKDKDVKMINHIASLNFGAVADNPNSYIDCQWRK